MRRITLIGRREFLVDDQKAKVVAELMLGEKEDRPGSIEIEGQIVKFPQITGVFSTSIPDKKNKMPYQDQVRQDFQFQEQEYKNQSPKEKAIRQYYGIFMNLMVSAYGLPKVFGKNCHSPMLDHPFDSTEKFEFTKDQEQDRRIRFDNFMRSEKLRESLETELKVFFVEFFEGNPKNSWCPLGTWREFVNVPTTRFDKTLIAHQRNLTGS